jgi:hypothetical protein
VLAYVVRDALIKRAQKNSLRAALVQECRIAKFFFVACRLIGKLVH